GGSAWAGALFCLKLAALIVPAMVLYEVLAPLPLFARLGRLLGPRLRLFGMSPPCTVPLTAGFFLGIAYGAGFIIPIAEEESITRREIDALGLFLSTCHAVIEDTLLFALIGARDPGDVAARMAFLIGVRLTLALLVTAAWARRAGVRGAKAPY
ncbi:MAG TPA: nucleoside recognition domain-containing protein, partial [Candidatus Polarisedimenticolia bacterium]|nr:nucleoside recognition domain-containing protein [Candidatus Polarisedimenticolia bacterium]